MRRRRFEVSMDIVNIDQGAVDDVDGVVPFGGLGAGFAVVFWALIVGVGGGQHDDPAAQRDLSVCQPALVVQPSLSFGKSECLTKPFQRLYAVFVGEHGNDSGICFGHLLF